MGYAKNIGHNLFTQITKILFGVLISIVVARALGPTGQGYVSYIILVFNLLGTFGHFGIISATPYFQKKSAFEREKVYNNNITALIIISLLLSVLTIILYKSRLVLGGYDGVFIAMGLLLMVFTLFVEHHQSWLMGDERIITNNRAGLTSFFLKNTLILILWIGGWLNPFSFFLVNVLALFVWFIIIQFIVGTAFKPFLSKVILKAEFAYGTVAWTSSLFAFLHYRADQFMIKGYLGLKELGVYTVAVSIAELLFLLPMAIHSALSGRLYNQGDEKLNRSLVSHTFRLSMSICLGLCVAGAFASFLIPFVYSQAYVKAVGIMLILLPGVFFACAPKLLSPWFFTTGRPKVHLYATMISLGLNISLNALFIPFLGSNGAALASTISYFFYGLYYIIIMRYIDGFAFGELLLPKMDDIRLVREYLRR